MRRALTVLLLVTLPGAAHACAVCGAAVDRNKSAFVGSTILLSLLPLALIGAGLWWIGRRAGAHLAGEFADRESLAGAPAWVPAGDAPVPAPPVDRAGVVAPMLAGPAGGGDR